MSAFQINDAEWEALEGLPYIARCLYLVIRRNMDFKTGITGITRKISWQSLCEELFVEPHQGRRESGAPAKERLRKVSQLLVDPGLIEIFSPPPPKKLLVFKCPLATTDQSVQNKEHIKSTYQEDMPKPSNGGASQEKEHSPETPKEHTPPVSGKKINTTTTTTANLKQSRDEQPTADCGGGGEDEKKKPDAQTKQRNMPLVCAVPQTLIYPKRLRPPEQQIAGRMVAGLGDQAQQLLDVLAAAIAAGEIRKTPLDYLQGLVRRCQDGTFDPTPGLPIAEQRKPVQTQRQGRSRREKAAERAMEERLREYERQLQRPRAP
jgi:hypothetical protein